MTTLALILARWGAGLRWSDVPAGHQERVKTWVLDSVGLMLASCELPPSLAVRGVFTSRGGAAEARVIPDGRRLPADTVALVHSAYAHCMDFDDTFPDSVIHPGSLVVPTALAVGEAVGANGQEVLAAVAAGYEAGSRMGAAGGRQFHGRGFQSSGIFGPLMTALVAGKLFGLTPERIAQAMGLAGSMSGSLLEFTSDGSWSKRLHLGWAAHGGILAARLAAAGFPGPASILEGRFGIYNAFLGKGAAQTEGATADLGSDWRSRNSELKFYPTAHVIQPFLEAALDLRRRENLEPREIERIGCRVAPWYAPIVCTPRQEKVSPRTDYQAQGSLPYALAAALVDGRLDMDTFTAPAIARREILDMAARVTHVEDEQLTGFEGVLEILTRGGQRLSVPVTPPRQDDPERVLAKFRSNAGRQLPETRVRALEAVLTSLEQRPLTELLDALVPSLGS